MTEKDETPSGVGKEKATRKEFVDVPKTGAATVKTEKVEKDESLEAIAKSILDRFNDKDPEDETKPGSKAKAFVNQAVSIRVDTAPRKRILIGVNNGIHTYVIVSERHGKIVAQLYHAIPANFHKLVVPEIRECGIEIDSTPFHAPRSSSSG